MEIRRIFDWVALLPFWLLAQYFSAFFLKKLFMAAFYVYSQNDYSSGQLRTVDRLRRFTQPNPRLEYYLFGSFFFLTLSAATGVALSISWRFAFNFKLLFVCIMSSRMSEALRYREVQEIVDYVIEHRNLGISILSFQVAHPEGYLNRFYNFVMKPKADRIECSVCFQRKNRGRVPPVASCLHRVCFSCVLSYVDAESKRAEGTTLVCPHGEEHCGVLYNRLLEDILDIANPEMRKFGGLHRRLERSRARGALSEVENIVECPSADCNNAIFSEDPLDEAFYLIKEAKKPQKVAALNGKRLGKTLKRVRKLKRFKMNRAGRDLRATRCRECQANFCVLCKLVWNQQGFSHEQLFCSEFQESFTAEFQQRTSVELKRMRKAGELRDCPNCGAPIEKNEGCKHMTCVKCKHEYCWHCHGNWRSCDCPMYA